MPLVAKTNSKGVLLCPLCCSAVVTSTPVPEEDYMTCLEDESDKEKITGFLEHLMGVSLPQKSITHGYRCVPCDIPLVK